MITSFGGGAPVFQTAACPDRISVRTAFVCVTIAVTSPQERIYISAGVTRRPFGFQLKGWCLPRSGKRSERFRCYFAMGKIRGTSYMRSHIFVHALSLRLNLAVFGVSGDERRFPCCRREGNASVPRSAIDRKFWNLVYLYKIIRRFSLPFSP
jgi:hypothetical protein